MKNFFLVLMFITWDVTTSTEYTCDRHAACGCSKRSTIVLSKIIGGEPVNVSHTWGWIGSLRRDGYHQCGASLLTPQHVITAAHCVNDIILLSRLSLNFGITNLSYIGQLRNVSRMYIHPEYNAAAYLNDIAILRLDEPLNLMYSNLSTICLPAVKDYNVSESEYPPANVELVAIGWGVTEALGSIPSQILRQVTVQAISRTDSNCQSTIYNDTVQFCAGLPEGGKDTCRGDSGGPLMLFKNRRWELAGITSYGEICAAEGIPGVYTRVAYFQSFITETLRSDVASASKSKQLDANGKTNSSVKMSCAKMVIHFVILYVSFSVVKTVF